MPGTIRSWVGPRSRVSGSETKRAALPAALSSSLARASEQDGLSRASSALVQTRRELRHRLHFALAHSRCDLRHDLAVDVLAIFVGATISGFECLQLRQRVVGKLTADAGISRRNSHSIGGMACSAGRNAVACVASAKDFLSGDGLAFCCAKNSPSARMSSAVSCVVIACMTALVRIPLL